MPVGGTLDTAASGFGKLHLGVAQEAPVIASPDAGDTAALNSVSCASAGKFIGRGSYTDAASHQQASAVGAPAATAPVNTSNPFDQVVNARSTATFIAAVSGTPTPTVQWEVSTYARTSFSTISRASAPTLIILSVTASDNAN